MAPRGHGSAGSVLVLALWTLFFLSALALAVAAYVGGGIGLASALKDDRIAYFAARAGVAQAIAIVVCDSNGWDALTEDWSDSEDSFRDVAAEDGRFTVSYAQESKDGKTRIRYGLSDEESRINLNWDRTNRAVLMALLERAGRVDAVKARRIAEAIIDWRDTDDQRLTSGAENAYYQALPGAYKCGNGPMKSVEELLLVRGVGADLFAALEP
jgi:general secretion pathway protein K